MNVRKAAETDLAVTLEWDPVPAAKGFIYSIDGDQHLTDGKRHFTFDGSQTSAKISKPTDGKPHTFEVTALGAVDKGSVTIGGPTPPPPDPGNLRQTFTALQSAKVPAPLGASATRIIQPTSPSEALAAINGIRAGDSIRLPPGLTIPGRVILGTKLASPAEVLCNGAKFVGVDNSPALSQGRFDTIFVGSAANIRMYDGEVTQAANSGIRNYGDTQNIGFYRFKVHDTNGSGLLWQPINGDLVGNVFVGEIYRCGIQWFVDQFDPHAEKGTGVHAIYLGGAPNGWLRGGGIYVHIHDQPFGCGIQTNLVDGSMELAAYAERLTFRAQSQVAANVIQAWGSNGTVSLPFLYGEDCNGRVVDTNTGTPDSAYSGMVVQFARAHNMCLAPSPGEGNIPAAEPFDPRRGIVYKDKAVI